MFKLSLRRALRGRLLDRGPYQRVIAVVCGVTVLLTLGGCGTVQAPKYTAPSFVEQTEDRLRDVASAVHGAADDWQAAEWLQYRAFQTPLDQCMAANGHDYRMPAFVSVSAARESALIPDTFHALAELPLGSTLVPSVAADTAAIAEQERAKWKPSLPEPSTAYSNALTTCGEMAVASTPEWPQPNKELAASLFTMMEQAVTGTAVMAETAKYPACMVNELGVDVTDQIDLYQLVHSRYAPFLAYYYDPRLTLGSSSDRAWDTAVAFEARAAAADRVCRTAAHEAALVAIAPLLDRFRSDNAAALAENEAAWAQLRAEAEAAGFSTSGR